MDPCEKDVEGSVGDTMGGETPTDSSGTLKYLRVQYAGYEVFPGNELNGITFGGVGTGTTVEYIQVHNNEDDCVEFFGGTVNVKYLICTGAGDDNLDIDWGYRGKMQFVIVKQSSDRGDHIVESDSVNSDAAVGYLTEPRTQPSVSNFTFISSGLDDLDNILASLANSITLIVVVGIIVSILASLLAGNYMRASLVDLEKVASAIGEGSFKKKDLKSLPVERSDEIGSVARDISSISTDLKNQISLIAKQRNQFGAVLDGLGEGILMCDQDGIINFRNDFLLQIFGFDEILDLSIHELKIPAVSNMFKKARKRGMFNDEFEIEDDDDKTLWILAHMNKSKATNGMILMVHDITQLRQMDSMRRDFVSNLSHELRTPVSVIKANS